MTPAFAPAWFNDTTVATYALRTGGFVQTVFAAIACKPYPEKLEDQLQAPEFAGYCLDAPDHLPAGSTRALHSKRPFAVETTAFIREN
jgi:hypothetical protein